MNGESPSGAAGSGDQWARERLAAIAHMASLVGHEARNKLATLRGAIELLEAGKEANMSQEYRSILLRELDDFVDDFNLGVDMIRCNASEREDVSVDEIASDVIRAFRPNAARAGIKIEVVAGHAVERVRLDRRLLRVTLLNLMRNSAEALADSSEGRIILRSSSDSQWLSFEVEDNGPGVPRHLHGRLFARPGKNEEEGSGLGLSLCRDSMVLMKGSIAHVSQPGEPGARFRVKVPLSL